MTPPAQQRSDDTLPRERPAPPARPPAATPRLDEPARSVVTAYDEIWFQGRPQLP